MQAISKNPVHIHRNNEQTDSLAYELSTLGGLLQDNHAWPEISTIVQTDDFADDRSQLIFRAIHGLAADGKPFDVITVLDKLERMGTLADAGGQEWLGGMVRDTLSAANVISYATIVKRKSLERHRVAAATELDFDRVVELTAEIKALETRKTVCTLHTIDEILDMSVTHDWLIKNWIERQQTIVLWGESQSYKTLLAIEMACAVATGMGWRGNKTQKGAVLYVVGEGTGGGITRRFRAWEIANKVSLRGSPLIIREVSTRLPDDTATLIQETEQFLRERGWKLELIILDTLSRTLSGDENSQKDFGQYQHALDQIRDKFQCAAMFLHHTGHNDKSRARGSSSIRGNVDVELSMEPVGNKVSKLHAWKVKDAGASEDMYLQLTEVDLGCFDEDGKSITSVVLYHKEDYMSPASTVRMSDNERLALEVIERMHRDISGTTPNVTDVAVTDWRSEFYAAVRKNEPKIKQDTLRKNWNRAINGLAAKGKVTMEGINNTRASVTAGQKRDNVTVVTPGHTREAGTDGTHTFRCVPLSRSDVPPVANVREDNPKGDSDSKESDQPNYPDLGVTHDQGGGDIDEGNWTSLMNSGQPGDADDDYGFVDVDDLDVRS